MLSKVRVTYHPDYPDDGPDPGEIVWARVPYQDDPSQSKDRPVLVIGRVNGSDKLAAVQLTSNTSARDSLQIGDWEGKGRQSSVKLGRIVQVDASNYRREGKVLGRKSFDSVVGRLAAHHRTPVTIGA